MSFSHYGHLVLVIAILLLFHFPCSFSQKVKFKYLKFSNQKGPVLSEASNFATLKSGSLNGLPQNKFTICSSIYIGFYRGHQTFYTLRRNNQNTLWFSLTIDNQFTTEDEYSTQLPYFGGSVLSNTGEKLRLNPHAWSHACTTVDIYSGHVIVVINGILTINTTIGTNNFIDYVSPVFQNNLVLGVYQDKFAGSPSTSEQSEASVKDVNVFSVPMNVSQMADITTTNLRSDGDIVAWSKAVWTLSGAAKLVEEEANEERLSFPNLHKMAGFRSWDDCINLCPKIQKGGRVPLTIGVDDTTRLSQLYHHPDSKDWFWAPFRYRTERNFTDHYTQTAISPEMWLDSQPNGGLREQCTLWKASSLDGRLYDAPCKYAIRKMKCHCQFDRRPILRLRGLCAESKMDTHFTLMNVNGSVVFMGLTGTKISFLENMFIWQISLILEKTRAVTSARESTFVLGRQPWSIEGDSAECSEGKPYHTQLKLSGCNTNGEFTCDDGQCITMTQRCDQIPDCRDKSDERRCNMLVTEEGYNKEVPPFRISSNERSIVPVGVMISINLLKIVDIKESEHKIDFQFEITLQWNENDRVLYHNLKLDNSLNALSKEDISKLWLPLVIYDNTDQKEVTRLGEFGNGEWNTPISVIREGNFTRSGLEVVDETEVFEGGENTLSMQQVYTWQFQCNYDLHYYPFDTQV